VAKYASTLKRLVAAGYPRARALLAVYAAFGLTAEQLVILDRLTREVSHV
jgi:hypothetical protein